MGWATFWVIFPKLIWSPCAKPFFFKGCFFILLISEMSNDQMSNDQMLNDKISNDKMSNDKILNNKMLNDKMLNDKMSKFKLSTSKCQNHSLLLSATFVDSTVSKVL
jgi:pentapeptide MXKDX repeat protein